MKAKELRLLRETAQATWQQFSQVPTEQRPRRLVAALLAHDHATPHADSKLHEALPTAGRWSQPGPARWAALLQAWLDLADAGENASARTRLGAFFTPPALVGQLTDWALQPAIDQALSAADPAEQLAKVDVLDPSCGAGAFLAAAAVRLHAAWQGLGVENPWQNALASVHGFDIEPAALAVCRATLLWLAGGQGKVDLCEGDFLLQTPRPMAVVLGNPPFLGQMKAATVRTRAAHAQLLQRLGDAVGPYTDTSALFLACSLDWLRPGGRLALVQPLSLVASRDAAGVRRLLSLRAPLQALWLGLGVDFGGAAVDVCAPLVVAGGVQPAEIQAMYGDKRVQTGLDGDSWSPLLAAALGVPAVAVAGQGMVGDLAQVTADFRDEYYGIQPYVVDAPRELTGLAPLMVTAHIEPLQSLWGQGSIRFAKQVFDRPAVDLGKLAAGNAKLAKWAERRGVPKLVVATQCKVIEAAVDVRGEWLNTTPTLAVIPQNPADLWRLAAVLCCATVTALAWRRHAGTALAGTALKLSAKQVAGLPLPADTALWQKAAELLQGADLDRHQTRRAALVESSRLMAMAYAGQVDAAVEGFWLGRLGPSG